MKVDQICRFDEKEVEQKNMALSDQLVDMKRNFEDASSKKEWAEAKLQEMHH